MTDELPNEFLGKTPGYIAGFSVKNQETELELLLKKRKNKPGMA